MTRETWLGGVAVFLMAAGASTGAAAQQVNQPAGWSFDVAPYVWLPTVNGTLRHQLPASVGGSVNVKADASDYGGSLDAAIAFAATVRNGRFSLLTDVLYVKASAGSSRVESVDIAGVPRNPISSSLNASGSTTLTNTIWSLAGGYTLASGAWGQAEILAGFRYVGAEVETDYNINATLFGPRGNAGPSFGGAGRLSGRQDIWNGIIGLRGRINLGDSGFFLPYQVDIGSGTSNFTWQGFAGVGYQTGSVGVQLGWRYLSLDQGGDSLVRDISLSGAILAVNFSF